jgi:hypothetical protein
MKTSLIVTALVATLGVTACGRSDLGRSSLQVVVDLIEAASGAEPDAFGGTLRSDVVTYVDRTVNGQQVQVPTVFNDLGRARLRAILRDIGTSSNPAVPTVANAVTFTRYHVSYVRTDGRNVQGVDVPYAFDSAFTVSIAPGGDATASFDIVRHTAKAEAPLAALVQRSTPPIGQPQVLSFQPIISTIADVTFYGRDLQNNEIVVGGKIGISFGDFGDPE